jgi:proline iminopeptidase
MGGIAGVIEPQGWITVQDGTKLYYSTLGDGPDVVCVQAGFYFEDALAPLADGRTFVLLHQRGRGRSQVAEGAVVDIPHEAADLDVVRSALRIERWSLIGWSYMGMVAVSYALDHPGRVERIVHLCSLGPDVASYQAEMNKLQAKGLARTDPADLQRLNEMGADGLMDSDPVAYARQLGRVIVGGQIANRDVLDAVPLDSSEWPNEWMWRGREAWNASFQAWNERARLPSLEVPMLVVHATEDLIPYRAARDTATTAADARLFSIDDSGHWPWLERPDVFFPAVDTFLAGRWPDEAVDVRAG